MSEYFLGLIVFAFVGSMIFSLVPTGSSKRYVRLLCGLCSVGCIIFPLFGLFEDVTNGDGSSFEELAEMFETSDEAGENAVEIYNNFVNATSVKNAEETLKNDIIKALSIKSDAVDVKIELGENCGEFYINRVIVYLYPSAYATEPKKIREICENRLGAACEIIYK